MSHKPIIAYAVILYFLLVTQSTSGQFINFKTDKYWADIGLGSFNTFKYSNGIHENIGINLLKKRVLYKIQFQYDDEFKIMSPISPQENLYAFNILIGKQLILEDMLFLQLTTGIGAISGELRGENILEKKSGLFAPTIYNKEKIITPSLPLETELIFTPIKYAKIGFSIFGNINTKRPFYGFAIKAGLGKVR
ncbi:hypothetical protein Pedsa_1935 [Pseudopedobacter saltans DSM 12145]|uniref:Outer membrane protein beta-barrel domain-containing protein n=1 Tax=Pseudopedobacter saltans (strain ATCC 51119 / DSM 12145 / JCM 21818 / CCUG 39354 / LMG 10337 / NBRC 100064 / NCIMB 13643) TaxID=762903 RepID=F0S9D8_PSESL|nr:hypothetical protein [Pseudopedobacter saltans]ADY52488.1 hypothetical protein Pedsa_1935 [Pseudopedobacter saltans DSM 12145]